MKSTKMEEDLKLLKANIDILNALPFFQGYKGRNIKMIIKDIMLILFLFPMQFGTFAEAVREIRGI